MTRYTIQFSHFTADVTGYYAWDFMPRPPEDGFASRAEAELFLADNYAGADCDGVNARFEIVEYDAVAEA